VIISGYIWTLFEWPKLKTPTIPSVGRDVEQLELSYTAGENI
jgi:hypothetical protein